MSALPSAAFRAGCRIALAMAVAIPAVVLAPRALGAQGTGPSVAGNWVAPERASKRTSPTPATPASIRHGRAIFNRDCTKCHGDAGHGDGPQASSLDVRPKDLTADAVASQSDGALFWKLTEGFAPMPKADLSDADKWAVIDYIRTLRKKP